MEELVHLLNASSSVDPNIALPAGKRLTELSSNFPSHQLFAHLISIVLSSPTHQQQSALTSGGQLAGFIYLKNLILDDIFWSDTLDDSGRNQFTNHLFQFLASGRPTLSAGVNQVECLYTRNSLADLVGRIVKRNWASNQIDASSDIWSHLIDWSAWRSFRSSLRAISCYRLPNRQRQLFALLNQLMPRLVGVWQSTLDAADKSRPESMGAALEMTHLLTTILRLARPVNLLSRQVKAAFLINEENPNTAALFAEIVGPCFTTLERLTTSISHFSVNEAPNGAKLVNRLAKLLFALACSSTPGILSSDHALSPLLDHSCFLLFRAVGDDASLSPIARRFTRWLLAILLGFLANLLTKTQTKFPLTHSGVEKVKGWLLSTSDSNGSAHLTSLLTGLSNRYLTLSNNACSTLIQLPESCLAAGSGGGDSSVDASHVWPVDIWADQSLSSSPDLASLVGLVQPAGNGGVTLTTSADRQLGELLMAVVLKSESGRQPTLTWVRQFAQEIATATASSSSPAPSPRQLELLLRLVQLSLPLVEGDAVDDWSSLVNTLVGQAFATLQDPVCHSGNEDQRLTLACRGLCLLSCKIRHLQLSSDRNRQNDVNPNELVKFIGRDLPLDRQSKTLALRLVAAQSLERLLALNDRFDQDSFVPILTKLVHLIEDVSECETRIHLIQLMRSIIESFADLIDTNVVKTLVELLEYLWKLGELSHSQALKVTIINTISDLTQQANCLVATEADTPQEVAYVDALHQQVNSVVVVHLIPACLGRRSGVNSDDLNNTNSQWSSNVDNEALFDAGLRLWTAAVEGPGVRWSDQLGALLPLLVDTSVAGNDPSRGEGSTLGSLASRIETSEDAKIAQAYLQLAWQAGQSTLTAFLTQLSEPFWSSIVTSTCRSRSVVDSSTGQTSTDQCFWTVQGGPGCNELDDDQESGCRLDQLRLLTAWLSLLADHHLDIGWPPSLLLLIAVAASRCLFRAPLEANRDVNPKATQAELRLLARLGAFQHLWHHLTLIIGMATGPGVTWQSTLALSSQLSFPDSQSQPTILPDKRLLFTLLTKWSLCLDATSSSSAAFDRICLVLAMFNALTLLATDTAVTSGDHGNDRTDDEFGDWLEPVLYQSACAIEDHKGVNCHDSGLQLFNALPIQLAKASRQELAGIFSNHFQLLMHRLGGPGPCHALLNSYVDTVIRNRFESALRSNGF